MKALAAIGGALCTAPSFFEAPALPLEQCHTRSMEYIVCTDIHTERDLRWCQDNHDWKFVWTTKGWSVGYE